MVGCIVKKMAIYGLKEPWKVANIKSKSTLGIEGCKSFAFMHSPEGCIDKNNSVFTCGRWF